MIINHLKFDALEYLRNNEYSFANGPDVDIIIEFLEFLKEGILIDIPYRIYLRRSNWILPVPGKAPTSFELCVQYPGTYYNRSMSKVFTGQLENENQRRNFWKSAKQKNRESSNAYKKLKREYYKKIGK
jgi:hypothetical protein